MRLDLRWVTTMEIGNGCDVQIKCERGTKGGVCTVVWESLGGGRRARESRGGRWGEVVLCMRDQREGGRGGAEFVSMCSVRERTEGGGGCSCVVSFGKWFTEKNFVNHFPIFYTRFSGQWKSFVFD